MSSGISPNEFDDSGVAIEDGADPSIKAKVASDGSGNNRLYVQVDTTPTSNISIALTNKVRHDIDTTTVVLTGAYQTVYTYSGSGKFIGFALSCEASATTMKFTLDSEVIFTDVTFADVQLLTHNVNYTTSGGGPWTNADAKRFFYQPIFPISFSSLIKIELKEATGKRLFGTFVHLTKET